MFSDLIFDIDKKTFCFSKYDDPYRNYSRCGGKFRRRYSLDKLCKEQRDLTLWHNSNRNFRYRRRLIVSTFNYWVSNGMSRNEAYKKAVRTQIIDPPKEGQLFNLDSRTSIVFGKEES